MKQTDLREKHSKIVMEYASHFPFLPNSDDMHEGCNDASGMQQYSATRLRIIFKRRIGYGRGYDSGTEKRPV